MRVINVIDEHAAERDRLAANPQLLQDMYGLSGDVQFCHTPGSNPMRYWPPNYFYPTNDSTLCLVVFSDIGGKDLNHLACWADYLPGGAWDRIALWPTEGGSLPATELRMLGRVVSDYMNWLDGFGVLPRSSAGMSLQISEWNVWHLRMTNDCFKLKLGKDLLIAAIGSCSKQGQKAVKGAAVAAYAKALEVKDRVDKPAGEEAIKQFREFWNSVDAYNMGVQPGKDFHRLLSHGKTDKWLFEQRDWASVNPQMFIDASEVVLRAKEEARLKAAQLDEQRAALQLMQAEALQTQKERDTLRQEKEALTQKLRDAKQSSSTDKLAEKITWMEGELNKKTEELEKLQRLGQGKAEQIRSEEASLQKERDELNQAVERLERQLKDQESSWREKLHLEKDQWSATQQELEKAKCELQETLKELRMLREMDRVQVENAEAAGPSGAICFVP